MTARPDATTPAGPEGGGLGEADRALLLAMRTWAPARRVQPEADATADADPRHRLLSRLEPGWAVRMLAGLGDDADGPGVRAEARERLRRAHEAEARVDLDRIHPSWWARGLREESPSVRRAVVAASPPTIRGRLQAGLLLDNDDLRPERPPDPRILEWACALWTERLVGGAPEADDPPVIASMSSLPLRSAYRLCRHAGEIKQALAGELRGGRAAAFAEAAGPEFAAIARHDLRATAPSASKLPPRRLPARIGLLTIARLLADCEPFRVRWALQHWPYSIAKLVRGLMPAPEKRTPVMMHVESEILRAAWDRAAPGAPSPGLET